MNFADRAAVTLGADVGGRDADLATNVHVMALRKLLEKECSEPYSEVIKKFALVLRIDGNIQSWGKSGVQNVRLQMKSGYATADIFVPQEIWKQDNQDVLRRFLCAGVTDSVRLIAKRAAKLDGTVQTDRLIQDINRVATKFLTKKQSGSTIGVRLQLSRF